MEKFDFMEWLTNGSQEQEPTIPIEFRIVIRKEFDRETAEQIKQAIGDEKAVRPFIKMISEMIEADIGFSALTIKND